MEKKKFLLPIFGMIGALLLVMLLTFPILSMEVKDIKVGVISQDEGITTPNGKITAGDEFVKKILKTDNKAIKFQKAKSIKALKQNLENGKYYATITVPKDFTKNSLNKESKINVVINEGLNPMVTMQLSQVISALGSKTGISFDIKSINSVSSLGIKAMLLPMMLIMMTFITSLITSLLISLNIKEENKTKSYLKQLVYMLIMAFVIGFTVSALAISIANVDLKITIPALYLATVSIAIMLLTNGCISLLGKKGIIIPALLFILGMGLVQIPYEYLNGVWQVLVASWEPFRYIGIGLREVLYQGQGIFNTATISLAIVSLIGIILSVSNILKKER